MFTISRSFELQAAHFLPEVLEGHKCGKLHGHTYQVTIICQGEIDARTGWFMDFAEIDTIYMRAVHAQLDHRLLNDNVPNPTTEILCMVIWRMLIEAGLQYLHAVEVGENSRSMVRFQPGR